MQFVNILVKMTIIIVILENVVGRSWPDVCSCWLAHHYWEPHTPPTLGELRSLPHNTPPSPAKWYLVNVDSFTFHTQTVTSSQARPQHCEGINIFGKRQCFFYYSMFYNGRERFQSDIEIINIELYPPYLSLLSGHHQHKKNFKFTILEKFQEICCNFCLLGNKIT